MNNLPIYEFFNIDYKSLKKWVMLLVMEQIALALLLWNIGYIDAYMSIVIPIFLIHVIFVWVTLFFESDMKLTLLIQTLLNLGIAIQIMLEKQETGTMMLYYYITIVLAFVGSFVLIKVTNKASFKSLRRIIYIVLAVSWIALLIFGSEIRGAKAWIVVAGASFQVTEAIKLLVIVAFVAIFADAAFSTKKKIIHSLIILFANSLLFFGINELGSFMCILLVYFAFIFVWADKIRVFALLLAIISALGGLAAGIVAILNSIYVKGVDNVLTQIGHIVWDKIEGRWNVWIHLDSMNPYEEAYQPIQARLALNLSGLLGNKNFINIPEGDSDYIFISLVYYLGILIGIIVFLLFIFILIRSTYIYLRARNNKEALLSLGFAYAMFLQFIIAVAGTSNFFIMTGIGIGFLSNGFTNLLISEMFFIYILYAGRQADIFEPNEKNCEESNEENSEDEDKGGLQICRRENL